MRSVFIFLLSFGLVSTAYAQQWYTPVVPGATQPSVALYPAPSSPLQLQYAIFDSLVNAYSYFSWRQQPLWYDPDADFLVTIKRGDLNGNEIYYRYSGDRGESWVPPIGPIQLSPSDIPRYPSIASTILADGSISDTIFVYFFPIVLNGSWGSIETGIAVGSVFATQQLNGITGDNGQTYPISTSSKLRIFGGGEMALIVVQLFPPEGAPTSENNALGAILVDIFNEEVAAFIPPQWASTVFLDPGNPNSRTSTIVNVDTDPDGNLYFGAFGVFANASVLRAVPAVSKSTDGGETWSDFDTFPWSVLEEYLLEEGAEPDSSFISFGPKDFTVTGTDQYSFIVQCFEVNANKQQSGQPELRRLLEISKENGEWKVRTVADISGFVIAYEDTDFNQTGSEVQVARTPDGSTIMAKWLDFVGYISQDDFDGDGNAPDTVFTTDVFVAFRPANAATWSDPINVTQSLLLDRITHIAPLLPPDLQNIPLLNVISVPGPNETTPEAQAITAQRQLLRKQWVTITHFALNPTSVPAATPGTSQPDLHATIRPDQRLWISVRMPQPAPVTLDLYSLTGQHIARIFDGNVAGYRELMHNVQSLPPGAYLLRLQANGETKAAKVVVKY